MCDTIVAVHPGRPVWIGKNSDREPAEAQVVERHPAARHPPGARLRATHLEVPQAAATHEVWISRPHWMWGCEMGVALSWVLRHGRLACALTWIYRTSDLEPEVAVQSGAKLLHAL